MSIENRRRFGFSGISSSMRPRYVEALSLGIELLQHDESLVPEIGDWYGDLKGMYTRCYKRDQADWYAVWTLLGEPSDFDCRRISGWLSQLGKSLRSSDTSDYYKYLSLIPKACIDQWKTAIAVLDDDDAPVHSHIVQNTNFCDSNLELNLGEKRLLWSSTIVVDSVER